MERGHRERRDYQPRPGEPRLDQPAADESAQAGRCGYRTDRRVPAVTIA
ncbi:hypothetical protein [Natronosalvus rutilus]|uniref:Uncharacterized protein n=1 Tax=Natronosalvus rutilus TaxID=2953753 RepID=A0A9E7NEG1_9EURY|nr:hypothetical protein [Natronosalvus rutilus]UTF55981.1 hypothetical protein NGM29_21040 [Natronosalvus rutilus]